MSNTLLLDVGATHTRVALLSSATDEHAPVERQALGGVPALLELLADERERTGATRLVAGLAAALAADRRSAHFTNWDALLDVADLFGLGFEEVLLLNDLECSAWGLAMALEAGEELPGFEPLAAELENGAGEAVPVPSAGNRVLVAPGTGLGSAGLVDLGPGAQPRWRPVACELQHMEVPAHAGFDAAALERCAEHLGHEPTWEDFVSGRGLELLDALQRSDLDGPRRPAVEIGAGQDVPAVAALARYYGLLGRYARALAAAYMALGGVFVAGATTQANRAAIRASGLLATFREPSVLTGSGMEDVPVFLVPAELNLRGARAVAELAPEATGLRWVRA